MSASAERPPYAIFRVDLSSHFAKNGRAVRPLIHPPSQGAPYCMQATVSQRTTVIIPVYNGEKYIAEALASVAAQTDPAGEVILVDDGSTDATAEIALTFKTLSYIRQQNGG